MQRIAQLAALALLAVPVAATTSFAGPAGQWRIADGSANIEIKFCGANLCGRVSWAKDARTAVGSDVLVSMKSAKGDTWSGTIVNPVDGQRYAARMSMLGDETLKVEGCVMGGLICGGQQWSRLK
jgi:uncharacterized protein (DUF2147 family)